MSYFDWTPTKLLAFLWITLLLCEDNGLPGSTLEDMLFTCCGGEDIPEKIINIYKLRKNRIFIYVNLKMMGTFLSIPGNKFSIKIDFVFIIK